MDFGVDFDLTFFHQTQGPLLREVVPGDSLQAQDQGHRDRCQQGSLLERLGHDLHLTGEDGAGLGLWRPCHGSGEEGETWRGSALWRSVQEEDHGILPEMIGMV